MGVNCGSRGYLQVGPQLELKGQVQPGTEVAGDGDMCEAMRQVVSEE